VIDQMIDISSHIGETDEAKICNFTGHCE
jgi:hypothetical protein